MIPGPGFDAPELAGPALALLASLAGEAREDVRAAAAGGRGAALDAASGAALSAVTPTLVLRGLARLDGEARDHFVVSAPGAAAGVYAALARLGLFPPDAWPALLGRAGSPFEPLPTRDVPGVDWTAAGPAGSSLAAAAGLALAARRRGGSGRAFLLAGETELATGLAAEARRLARARNLANLCCVVLSPEPPPGLLVDFRRDGWHASGADGADPRSLHAAIREGLASGLPSLLACRVNARAGERDGREAAGTAAIPPARDVPVATLLARLPERPSGVVVPRGAGEPAAFPPEAAVSPAKAFAAALGGFSTGEGDPPAAAVLSGEGSAELAAALEARGPDAVVPCASPDLAAAFASGLSLGGVAVWWIASGPAAALAPGLHLLDVNGASVRVAAVPSGESRGADSHGLFGVVAALPGGKLFAPADANQADRIVRWVGVHRGSFVVSLPRHPVPAARLEDGAAAFAGPYLFDPKRADHLRAGEEIALACSGSSLPEALAAWELLAARGTRVDLFSLPSLTDVGEGALVAMARTGRLVAVDEAGARTGLGAWLQARFNDLGLLVRVRRLGVTGWMGGDDRDERLARLGLDPASVARAVEQEIVRRGTLGPRVDPGIRSF